MALVSPDGVAPSQMVGVSASVNLPLHHKVQSSLLAPAHPDGPGKRAVKRLWWWWCGDVLFVCVNMTEDEIVKLKTEKAEAESQVLR